MTYKYFIGFDVSKNKIDLAVLKGNLFLFHLEVKNDCNDINLFLSAISKMPGFAIRKCLFCMENNGHYNNHLLTSLKRLKAKVVVENPAQISSSLGVVRDKNDQIDAVRIGQYAFRYQDKLQLWLPKRPVVQLLAVLLNLRLRLIEMQMTVKIPLKEQEKFLKVNIHKKATSLCSRTTKAIGNDLTKVDNTIRNTIDTDSVLKHLIDLVTSVPNIGLVTAAYIITTTNEFRDINEPKKFACYAGVAPFARESGTMKGKRKVSPIANHKMKALLHTCAMGSVSRPGEMKTYYDRKTKGEGKAKMLVLNAIRYKLITRVYACVIQDRLYQKEYIRFG